MQTCTCDIYKYVVEAKGNVAFFFFGGGGGVNKAFVPNFHLNRHSFIIYTFSLFICKFQTTMCAIPSQLETVLRGPFQKWGK